MLKPRSPSLPGSPEAPGITTQPPQGDRQPMSEPLSVTCPDCKTILIVERDTGKVLEVRKPIVEESSGDRFEDARRKVLEAQERADKAFESARKREKEKFSKLEKLFEEKKEQFKDQPIERPDRPFDHD